MDVEITLEGNRRGNRNNNDNGIRGYLVTFEDDSARKSEANIHRMLYLMLKN